MNRKAFTLTEIMVSVMIISIIAAGMFSAFVGARRFFIMGRHTIQAYNFAREQYDRLRSGYNYNSNPQMAVGTGKPEAPANTIVRGEMKTKTNLNTSLTYDVTAGPSNDAYKVVDVTVSWEEPWE